MRKNTEELGPLSAFAIFGLVAGGFMGKYMGPRFAKEDDAGGAGGGDGKGKEGKEDTGEDDSKPTLSQKAFNAQLSAEKKKMAEDHKKQNDELLKSKNLTEKERKALEEKNKELGKIITTKEEQIEEERRNLSKKHEEEKTALTAESEGWRKQYFDSRVTTEITQAAVECNAKNPKQIMKMLAKDAILEPKRDKSGEIVKKDGLVVYEMFVPHEEEDPKTHEVKTKKLTIKQKVVAMAASEEDGNLFNSERRGGTGNRQGSGGQGGGGGAESSATKIGRGLAAKFGSK